MMYAKLSLLKAELLMTLNIPKIVREITAVLNEEPLWTGLPRKSYRKRCFENIRWYLKYKEACIYYNSYGFDIEGFRNQKDYMPYRQFRIERFLEDYPQNLYENKLCVLRDKVLFAAYFGDLLGEQYVVRTLGLINVNGSIYDFEEKNETDAKNFFDRHKGSELFVKKLDGECGEGCYLIDKDTDIACILNQMKGSSYIIQNRVEQHPEINLINPSCINTVRIITIVGKKTKTPSIFAHYMRVGCNAINDNRATGGVGVAITTEGKLQKYGVGHHKVEDVHSVTGKKYEGTTIPYWKEVCSLVIKAHESLIEIPSIGWDVAITPKGPVLIEGNDNWEISGAQDSAGGLRKRWYELHE